LLRNNKRRIQRRKHSRMLRRQLKRPRRWLRRSMRPRSRERSTRLSPRRRLSDSPSEDKLTRSWPRRNINRKSPLLLINIT